MAMTATDIKQQKTGLWAALASEVTRSAAGSVLAGPLGSGQPISVFVPARSMFAYSADDAMPVAADDLARIEGCQLACA
jgi:hypothetical protein